MLRHVYPSMTADEIWDMDEDDWARYVTFANQVMGVRRGP